jgi:hypothetical protein
VAPLPNLSAEERRKLVDMFAKNGIFAVLFTSLLFYTLYTSNQRELRLTATISQNQQVIQTLVTDLAPRVSGMQEDVTDIKALLQAGGGLR